MYCPSASLSPPSHRSVTDINPAEEIDACLLAGRHLEIRRPSLPLPTVPTRLHGFRANHIDDVAIVRFASARAQCVLPVLGTPHRRTPLESTRIHEAPGQEQFSRKRRAREGGYVLFVRVSTALRIAQSAICNHWHRSRYLGRSRGARPGLC